MQGGFLPDSVVCARSQLQLLWAKQQSAPISHLSRNVVREVALYLKSGGEVLSFCESSIFVFSVVDREFRTAQAPITLPDSVVFCWISHLSIALLGFGDTSVLRLTFPHLELQPLNNMRDSRSNPGILFYESHIYAFAGNKYYLSPTSEKLCISTGGWSALPGMQFGYSQFTPTIHKKTVYLAALRGADRLLETFDLITEEFHTHCKLPDIYTDSVSVLIGEEILLLTWKQAFRVRLQPVPEVTEVEAAHSFHGAVLSRSSSLLVANTEVWFAPCNRITAVCFNVSTLTMLCVNASDRR